MSEYRANNKQKILQKESDRYKNLTETQKRDRYKSEKGRESRKKYFEKNRDKLLECMRKYQKNNKEKFKEYRDRNIDNIREAAREKISSLSDSYVKNTIRKKFNEIKVDEITEEMIDAARSALFVKRLSTEIKKSITKDAKNEAI